MGRASPVVSLRSRSLAPGIRVAGIIILGNVRFRKYDSAVYENDGLSFFTDGFELAEVLRVIAVCDGSDIVPAGQ